MYLSNRHSVSQTLKHQTKSHKSCDTSITQLAWYFMCLWIQIFSTAQLCLNLKYILNATQTFSLAPHTEPDHKNLCATVSSVFLIWRLWSVGSTAQSSHLFRLHVWVCVHIQCQSVYGLQKSRRGIKEDWGSVRILFSSLSSAPFLLTVSRPPSCLHKN